MHRLHAMRAGHLRADQGLRRRLLAQAPVSRARRLTLDGRAGRSLRLPRPERRRQDHHAQAADAAGVSDVGPRRDPRPAASATCRCKRRIGYLPENPYFYDYLTAEELLDVLRRRSSAIAAAERRRARRRLLDEVGIGAERRLQLRKFSKGMLQRVGIAQALINDPELVILDEPMSGLDPLGRRDVRALILRLRDRGCTVFFSSHVLSDAEALCSRVAILAKGRLVAGRPADRDAGVSGARLGAGRRRRQRRARSQRSARACDARRPHRRRPLHARAAARSAARARCSPSSPPPARSWCRSTRSARRSRTSSSSRSPRRTARAAIAAWRRRA